MNQSEQGSTIGTVAEAAGVNVEPIRFYQRKGLMPEPKRVHGSVRRYGDADLARLRFIKSSQRLGFSLDEIGELLKLEDGTHCREARMLALQKLADVRRKLAELNRIDAVLVNMIAQCGAADGHVQCPMIVSLLDTPGMPT